VLLFAANKTTTKSFTSFSIFPLNKNKLVRNFSKIWLFLNWPFPHWPACYKKITKKYFSKNFLWKQKGLLNFGKNIKQSKIYFNEIVSKIYFYILILKSIHVVTQLTLSCFCGEPKWLQTHTYNHQFQSHMWMTKVFSKKATSVTYIQHLKKNFDFHFHSLFSRLTTVGSQNTCLFLDVQNFCEVFIKTQNNQNAIYKQVYSSFIFIIHNM